MKIFDAATWPKSLTRTIRVLLCGAVFSGVYFAIALHRADSGLQRVELNVAHGLDDNTLPSSDWRSPRPDCGVHKDPGNIAIIVKTGATVISERLPTLLLTSLRCVDNPLIFSDLEQEFGGHHVYDVLSNFSRKEGNADFDLYRTQQEYAANGRHVDLPNLRELPIVSSDWRTKGKSAAWSLDKYKFLHMIDKAWELRPDQDWYLFLEADTFISWANLLRWLPSLDPRRKLYLGSAVRMYESPYLLYFANGGSGMLLSGAAVSEFAAEGVAQKWDRRISEMWFGDYVLAAALYEEMGLQVTDAKPTMIHDEPSLIAFHSDMWCKPVVALHHLTSEEQDHLWKLDQARNTSALLFRDVYNIAYPRGLPSVEAQWDNLAQDSQYAVDSITDAPKNGSLTVADTDAHHKACQRACQRNDKCLQYVVHTQLRPLEGEKGHSIEWSCHLSRAFTLGRSRPAESGPDGVGSVQSWMSGWMSERIAEWSEQHQECAEGELVWPAM